MPFPSFLDNFNEDQVNKAYFCMFGIVLATKKFVFSPQNMAEKTVSKKEFEAFSQLA